MKSFFSIKAQMKNFAWSLSFVFWQIKVIYISPFSGKYLLLQSETHLHISLEKYLSTVFLLQFSLYFCSGWIFSKQVQKVLTTCRSSSQKVFYKKALNYKNNSMSDISFRILQKFPVQLFHGAHVNSCFCTWLIQTFLCA